MLRAASKASAIFQSLIALSCFALLLYLTLEGRSGIDPREDKSFAQSLWNTLEFLLIPIVWSTAAAILIWKRKAVGHWLSGVFEVLLATAAALALSGDIRILPTMPSSEGVHAVIGDAAIHSAVIILCAAGSFLAIRTRPAAAPVTYRRVDQP